MSNVAKTAEATLADLLAIPEDERYHEIIDGELVRKAMPSARHGGSQANLVVSLGGPYGRRTGGDAPGGWRFLTESEVRFDDRQIYRPDIAAWRRERMPRLSEEFPIALRPDWVCEILSPTNQRNDTVKKMRTYQRAGVPHYWLVDPVNEVLVVYRWTAEGYLLVQSAQNDERVRAEPFGEVELSVRSLLDDDED